MKTTALSFCLFLITMLILDGVWLGTMYNRFYLPNIGHLTANSFQLIPALCFYLLYALGLTIFVLNPGLQKADTYFHILLMGALFGAVAYGTYDLTNHATLKNWPAIVTIVDLAWGTTVTGIACALSAFLTKYLLNQ